MNDKIQSIADEIQEQARKNTKGLLLFFVALIVLGVVGFCEILYVAMIIPAFPDGLVQSVAIAGACATGASAVALLVGKLHWFSKGNQSYVAWGFVGVETAILGMNVLLAVQLHNGHVAPWLAWWAQMYPAAPLAAFVGWGLILFFDKDNEMRVVRRENKERQEKKELDYENLVHHTTLEVKHESLQILTAKLRAKIASASYQQGLDVVADQIANGVLGQMSGSHITSLLPSGNTVEGSGHAVPQTADAPAQPVKQQLQESPTTPEKSQYLYEQMLRAPAVISENGQDKVVTVAEWLQWQAQQKPTSPLAQPQLDATASQAGTNGNGHREN